MSEQCQMQGAGSEPGSARSSGGGRDRGDSGRAAQTEQNRGSAARNTGLGSTGRAVLEQVVQRSVVPMLVAMPWMRPEAKAAAGKSPKAGRGKPAPKGRAGRNATINKDTVARLVTLSLAPDGRDVAEMIAGLHEAGASPEAIYTELLTPVARRLGEMWEHDECSFADVTMGVLRLQNAQRALAPSFLGTTKVGKGAPRALLMPVPGEQHTFGLTIVADFFTRAGWDTWTGVASEKVALQMVRNERIDMVGLSFACDERIDTAARLIAELRSRAANPGLVVMVGGPSFVADPGLAARVGADATAADAQEAVLRANELLHRGTPSGGAGGRRRLELPK